jgi:hypothetical protein
MFQFAHRPRSDLCIESAVSRHHSGWVAPFGFSGLIACVQLPLNVSPVSASFFGVQRLGIHLVLDVACYSACSRISSASFLLGFLLSKIEDIMYVVVKVLRFVLRAPRFAALAYYRIFIVICQHFLRAVFCGKENLAQISPGEYGATYNPASSFC